MAIRASSGLVEDWYTPISEEDEDQPTRFKLKPLTQLQVLEVFSEGEHRIDGAFVPNHYGRVLLLRRGLVGWENLLDESENMIPYEAKAIDLVPAQILGELAIEILQRSSLSVEEKKS